MSETVKNKKVSREIKAEATQLIKALNLKGETRGETQRLTAGVQRALEAYLRQHKARARELDKKAKKLERFNRPESDPGKEKTGELPGRQSSWLPWCLLALSWAFFVVYNIWFRPW